jgi:HIRAN domain
MTMEHWITRASEPDRLYLAWQAPDQFGDRFRWAVGVIERQAGAHVFRYLEPATEFPALNQGRTFEDIQSLGFVGYPPFSPKRALHVGDVLTPLIRRLPPRRRSDFLDYTRQFRLAPELELSDFALLGRTEAKLPSDGFSVVDPLDRDADQCDLMLEIAGFRYYICEKSASEDRVGQLVEVSPEPNNPKDPNAVQFCLNGRKIGNVNRLQASTFLHWLSERRVSAVVERLNGNSEKPRAFVFVKVRPLRAQEAA